MKAVWGTTSSCDPEQIYGQADPPSFATREEAEAAIARLLPGAQDVAEDIEFTIVVCDPR